MALLPGVRRIGAVLAACVTLAACSMNVSTYQARPLPAGGSFRVGVGRADITPTPCYPTGGHGPAGAVAHGHWTRLYAKAFYFADGQGHQIVLVATDLWAIPAGLHAVVSHRLHREGVAIAPQELLLGASHTHQGPGNYLSARGYNQYGASYPGFRRALFEFLADRISGAILDAIEDARASEGKPLSLRWRVGRADQDSSGIDPFVVNRMPGTVLLNIERDELMDALNPALPRDCRSLRRCANPSGTPVPASAGGSTCEPEKGWDLDGCPRLRMADQTLQVLEIERDTATIGLMVFFAVHPTVLQATAPVFSSDLTGIAMSRLEAARPGVVAAFFNGAEGDIVPRRLRRDVRDVERLGNTFAARIERVLLSTPLEEFSQGPIQIRQTDVSTKTSCVWNGQSLVLASKPKFGAAAFGGAEGDRTVLYDLGFHEGMRAQPDNGQGPKLPALDSPIVRFLKFTRKAAPPEAFPKDLPITLATMGPLTFASVPVEMTTAMAHRLYGVADLDRPRLAFLGLSNEYASYNTSPEEYVEQEYTGASTIWGPREGPLLACEMARLKASTEEIDRDIPPQEFYIGAKTSKFGPKFCGDARGHPDELLEPILLDATGRPARRLPWFRWEEPRPRDDFAEIAARRVSVQQNTGTGWEQRTDDAGTELITTLLDFKSMTNKKRVWAALWIGSLLHDPPNPAGEYRFCVTWTGTNPPPPSCSKPFTPAALSGREPIEAAP
jgi:neutral ceramidase